MISDAFIRHPNIYYNQLSKPERVWDNIKKFLSARIQITNTPVSRAFLGKIGGTKVDKQRNRCCMLYDKRGTKEVVSTGFEPTALGIYSTPGISAPGHGVYNTKAKFGALAVVVYSTFLPVRPHIRNEGQASTNRLYDLDKPLIRLHGSPFATLAGSWANSKCYDSYKPVFAVRCGGEGRGRINGLTEGVDMYSHIGGISSVVYKVEKKVDIGSRAKTLTGDVNRKCALVRRLLFVRAQLKREFASGKKIQERWNVWKSIPPETCIGFVKKG
ncbi:hypothetical protein K440DRAFT_640505 [Wilcoxina mikolae CBS 423.85]|nr:hypothetical protein K440DRAFT_640505 [Wilcoxina mikolae CBS 423.85]